MKKPSQNLTKQLQMQEQQLLMLQNSIKAAQKSWEDQKNQIARDTEVTIETSRRAIEDATQEAKLQLDKLNRLVNKSDLEHRQSLKRYSEELETINAEIALLERDRKVAVQLNSDLTKANMQLESKITINEIEVAALTTKEETLSIKLGELTTKKESISTQINEQTTNLVEAGDAITVLTSEYNTKKKDYTHELATLELKKQDLMSRIMETRSRDDEVRENLAIWERKLTDRDNNLRVREARVDQQEKSIARNYNLLNL